MEREPAEAGPATCAGEEARQAQERLERLLLDGLASGPGIEATREFWERKQAELLARCQGGRV